MKLSELIAKHGDDDVQFQNLDTCLTSANMSTKPRSVTTSIGFKTEMGIDPVTGTTERLGLVVWLDREKVAAIRSKL